MNKGQLQARQQSANLKATAKLNPYHFVKLATKNTITDSPGLARWQK